MKSPKQLAYGTFIVTLLALGVLLYYEKSLYNQNLTALENELRKLQLKSEADEYFISGMYNKALDHYNRLDSLYADSLYIIRSRQIPQNDSPMVYQQLLHLTSKLRQTMALLEHYKQNQTIVINDSSSRLSYEEGESTEEIFFLRERLAAAQQEINRLKNARGIIRFTTARNGKVTYFGDLENNMASGNGFGYWSSGSTYEGTWKNNKRHGKGVFQWVDGEKYEGEYVDDMRHGFGIYTSKAGRYEGFWANDMRHGEGKLYEPNGKLKVHGIWEKDKLIKTIK